MTDADERFVVTVSDHAPTPAPGPLAPARDDHGPDHYALDYDARDQDTRGQDDRDHDGGVAISAGFGLAVISGLADDVRVSSTSSGVSVRMSWPSAAAPA